MTDDSDRRRQAAFIRRNRAARQQLLEATVRRDENVDDAPATNFGKGLSHDEDGVPTAAAYESLVAALEEGTVAAYNAIDLGGDGVPGSSLKNASRRLVEPNGALSFQNIGADPHAIQIRPHPAFSDSQSGAEMIELYWRALLRDVHYGAYDNDTVVGNAVSDLKDAAGYAGPRSAADPRGGDLSPKTLFRGIVPGAQTGPRISQFLWKDIPRGAIPLSQRIRVLTEASTMHTFDSDELLGSEQSLSLSGPDYLTDFDTWYAVQQGVPVEGVNPPPNLVDKTADPDTQATRHLITGRDLANKVRRQVPYLSIRDAAEILLGMGVPKDPHIPCQQSKHFDNDGTPTLAESGTAGTGGVETSRPFLNFGAHDVLDTVVDVFMTGQNACWYRKWAVHRRLRPEEYGGRIHVQKTRNRSFPIPDNVLDSEALKQTNVKYDSYLLPQAYTEGSPTHPSFPAGHSGVAGACVTVLKAMFDGKHAFSNDEMMVPVANGTTEANLAQGDTTTVQQTALETVANLEDNSDGTIAATQSEIDEAADRTVTVNDELNKLAANMAFGRNWAGIHYRTDGIDGFLLGEQAAVRYLQDHLRSHSLPFDGYRLEPFFDKYPGTLEGAMPNTGRGTIIIRPEEIVNNESDASIEVDDPIES